MKTSRKLVVATVLLAFGLAAPSAQAKKGSEAPASLPVASISSAAQMKEKLALSDEQYAQVEKIYADKNAAIKALVEKKEAPEVLKIEEEAQAKVDAVITPEQKAKLTELTTPSLKKKKVKKGA